ncbi:MAG: hypothetical protein IJ595_07055 [Oscillospiraceae bacterium]|nr:hypothetical protein [Oscillospiraceae bacterium]
MTKKKAFMVYIDNETQVNLLDDAAAGKLFKALFRFARGEDVGFEDGMLQMICSFMTAQMARDLEKYERVCRRNLENAKKGGRPKKTPKNRTVSKKTDTGSDSVSDSESDTETETETDNDTVCDSDTQPAGGCTPHTQGAAFGIPEAMALAQSLGYGWDEAEAASFVEFNRRRGRTNDWTFAAERWEAQRLQHRHLQREIRKEQQEQEQENEYLALIRDIQNSRGF